jgi:hypothetical protein
MDDMTRKNKQIMHQAWASMLAMTHRLTAPIGDEADFCGFLDKAMDKCDVEEPDDIRDRQHAATVAIGLMEHCLAALKDAYPPGSSGLADAGR